MAIAHGGLLIGHLLFARALPGSMYAASILTGLCSGIQWTVIGPTISELFGLKHFGLIYSTICTASALGSLLFSSLVGHLYDHECQRETYIGNTVLLTKKAAAVLSFSSSSSSFSRLTLTNSFLQKAAAAETTCLAAHCFKLAFFIMAVVCLVGVFINLTLAARTQNLYQSLHKLHSSTTTFSDDDDDDYDCEVKCDSDPILPH
jgi:MFS family permease